MGFVLHWFYGSERMRGACVCVSACTVLLNQHCVCAAAMTTLYSMSDHVFSSKVSGNKRSPQPRGSTRTAVHPTPPGVELGAPNLGGFLQRTPKTLRHPRAVRAAQPRWVGSSAPGLPQRPPGWHYSPRLWCPLVLALGVPGRKRQIQTGKTWGPLISGRQGGDARSKHQFPEVWAALANCPGTYLSPERQTRGCQVLSLASRHS